MPGDTQQSVLDDLGEEITGIAFPVAACMALTVLLVRVLNPEGDSRANTVYIASIAYSEQTGDTAGQKLGGALLNAIIFISVIAGMTFLLFMLFKYRCYRVIYGYMAFALFNVFFFLTGAICIELLKIANVHMDAFSLTFLLFNFSIVGILGMFFMPVPLLLKQCYTVWVGIITAYLFTYIPEWTSWVLLVLMALYDLAAVLMPGGPLKILVEMAMERQQELPALVYEARPVGRPYERGHWGRRSAPQAGSPSQSVALLDGAERGSPTVPALGTPVPPPYSQQQQQQQQQQRHQRLRPHSGAAALAEGMELALGSPPSSPGRPLLQQIASGSSSPAGSPGGRRLRAAARPVVESHEQHHAAAGAAASRVGPARASTWAKGAVLAASARGGPLGEGKEVDSIAGTSSSGADGARDHVPHAPMDAEAPAVRAAAAGLLDAVLPPGLAPIRTRSGVGTGPNEVPDDRGVLGGGPLGHENIRGPDDQGPLTRRNSRQRVSNSHEEAPGQQPTASGQGVANAGADRAGQQAEEDEESDMGLPDAIKLGLGDFIFYSMLVGRAAMYDMMTVYAAFLAIISGLGITLLLLALMRKALPALPVSIALGVVFYFLTRLTLEPYMVPLAANLAYY